MEVTFETAKIREAMEVVAPMSTGSAMPILANVKMAADAGEVWLEATNLEVGIRMCVEAQVAVPGVITLPAKKLLDIVKAVVGDSIHMETTPNDRVAIVSGGSRFRVSSIDANQFPDLNDVEGAELSFDVWYLISKTIHAVSTDEMRHFLNGVCLSVSDGKAVMAATDGKRLAVAERKATGHLSSIILPTSSASKIVRTFQGTSDLKITCADSKLSVSGGDVVIVSRLIEGEYPDYNAVLQPSLSNEIELEANTRQLIAMLKRVALLAEVKTPATILKTEDSKLKASAFSINMGEAQDKMEVTVSGELLLQINAKFMLGVLNTIDSETVLIKYKDSISPLLIMPGSGEIHHNVIMPMRMEEQ